MNMLDKHEYIKITNAVYKILDYFPEGDPLKNKAKEKALAILEQVTVGTFSVELLNDVEVLKSYLSLARYQGFVNDMNFLIITKEYDQIKNQIALLEAQKKSVDILEKEIVLHTVKKEDKPEPEKKPETHQVAVPKVIQNSLKAVNRQKKILDILAEREKTQVADIVLRLPKVTKRTVRRDLDELLKEGRILRFGEWNQVFYQILR